MVVFERVCVAQMDQTSCGFSADCGRSLVAKRALRRGDVALGSRVRYLFLEESDDGRDVRDLRVRRPRRLGLLEREAALERTRNLAKL